MNCSEKYILYGAVKFNDVVAAWTGFTSVLLASPLVGDYMLNRTDLTASDNRNFVWFGSVWAVGMAIDVDVPISETRTSPEGILVSSPPATIESLIPKNDIIKLI